MELTNCLWAMAVLEATSAGEEAALLTSLIAPRLLRTRVLRLPEQIYLLLFFSKIME